MCRFTVVLTGFLISLSSFIVAQTEKRVLYDEIALEKGVVDPRTSAEASKLFFIEPGKVTNSHKPQYYNKQETQASGQVNSRQRLSFNKVPNHRYPEERETSFDNVHIEDEYKPSNHMRNKQDMIKAILVKILEKNDQKKKFAEVLPILKVMSPEQKLVMATLVSKQLTADARNPPLNLAQVRSMFGHNPNATSDLMLPIILDIANMFKDAKDHLKQQYGTAEVSPQAQMLRRSFPNARSLDPVAEELVRLAESFDLDHLQPSTTLQPKKPSAKISTVIKNVSIVKKNQTEQSEITTVRPEAVTHNETTDPIDAIIDAIGNETEFEKLPIAEKLRALNRIIDRNGNFIVLGRPPWGVHDPKVQINRKSSNHIPPINRRRFMGHNRHTLIEMARQKCDLFTNSLCLDTLDYPMDAISKSIRRNGPSSGTMLADFPDISADSVIDGVSAKQESKYTRDHYFNNLNRREDGVSTPVQASGFMCPSTVKYARPQKARATSGQWKYIVNTGEHTQTLRLEKCLRPKEACTYLTDNFKSTCVQVYNYHRLLTWDQQNGLHMDIFKVPTCCSCHIEGYSVSFPPHLGRPSETTSERFPGEDLAQDPDLSPFEDVKSVVRQKYNSNDNYRLGDSSSQNYIASSKYEDNDSEENPTIDDLKHMPVANQFENINSNFHTDVLPQPSVSVRNIKKPNPIRGAIDPGLSSYLEPPSKGSDPLYNNFQKTSERPKFKNSPNNHFKRGVPQSQPSPPPKRVNRRPQRKKITNSPQDQMIGASEIHENPTIINLESFDDIDDSVEELDRVSSASTPRPLRPTLKASGSKITIKNVAPSTTEPSRIKIKEVFHTEKVENQVHRDQAANRRVNYNYHPIIDFFENNRKAAERSDTGVTYQQNEETDWRPMAGPVSAEEMGKRKH